MPPSKEQRTASSDRPPQTTKSAGESPVWTNAIPSIESWVSSPATTRRFSSAEDEMVVVSDPLPTI